MRFPRLPLAAVAAVLLNAGFASAAIIGSTGYEGAPDFNTGYYYTYVFDYAGYGNGGPNVDLGGNAVNSTATAGFGPGIGGSGGFELLADSSAVPVSGQPYPTPTDPAVQYNYWGMGGGSGLAILNAPTSIELGDYRISMDLRAMGLLGLKGTVEFAVEFQIPDDVLGGDPDTGGDIILTLNFSASNGRAFLAESTFGNFSTSLDQYTSISAGSLATFAQHVGLVTNINVNVALPNGSAEFGLDAGNGLVVDNLTVEQVPEPSVVGLLGLGAAAVSLRRRRVAA